MPQPRPPFRRQHGFTLVEMLTVLMIIMILATIGLARMGRKDSGTASAGLAREIYALANQARMTALGTRKQVRLTLQGVNPAAQMQVATNVGGLPTVPNWGPVESQVIARQNVQVTGVDPGALYGTLAAPGAPPAPRGGVVNVIYYPDGTVQFVGAAVASGATVYIADAVMLHPQRVVMFGRTGFVKVLDR